MKPTDLLFFFYIFAFVLICIVVAGIWEIHKSINLLTAATIQQKEVLEKLLQEKKEENTINAVMLQLEKDKKAREF